MSNSFFQAMPSLSSVSKAASSAIDNTARWVRGLNSAESTASIHDAATAVARNLQSRLPQDAKETIVQAVEKLASHPIASGPLGRIDDAVWRFVVTHRPQGSLGPAADGASPVAAGTPAPWNTPTAVDAFFSTIHWVAQPGAVVTAGSVWALSQGILGAQSVRHKLGLNASRPAKASRLGKPSRPTRASRPWWDWDVRPTQAAAHIGFVVAAQACSTITKKLIGRERPPEMFRLAVEHARSFPSGHMIAAVAVCGTMVALRYAGRDETVPRPLFIILPAWCVLVGYDRLYMGVHWFSDLLGGAMIGGAWSFIAWKVQARLRATATS